ncbi:MAG: glutaredoxin family protein [Spirochaetales bacterium]
MSAIDKVDFEIVKGEREPEHLRVFSLSTCAFCRRAQNFLKENGITFSYVYIDQLDFDLKREVKAELKSKFDTVPVYPILLIGERDAVSGFVQEKWADKLGIEA